MVEAARAIDRINVAPRFTQEDAIRLNNMFRGTGTQDTLRTVLSEQLLGEIALVSSFGADSATLLHLVTSIDRSVPILFLDTGKHFPETLAYRDQLTELLGLNLQVIHPDPEAISARDESGLRWSYDPDGCCEIRKVLPLEKAMAPYDASITGRKAHQASTRSALPRFELDGDRMKFNPLADWTRDDVTAYFEDNALPTHPLVEKGYLSIGCAPCTSVVKPGEDPRSGRWRGWDKTECGIHSPTSDDDANQPVF